MMFWHLFQWILVRFLLRIALLPRIRPSFWSQKGQPYFRSTLFACLGCRALWRPWASFRCEWMYLDVLYRIPAKHQLPLCRTEWWYSWITLSQQCRIFKVWHFFARLYISRDGLRLWSFSNQSRLQWSSRAALWSACPWIAWEGMIFRQKCPQWWYIWRGKSKTCLFLVRW